MIRNTVSAYLLIDCLLTVIIEITQPIFMSGNVGGLIN